MSLFCFITPLICDGCCWKATKSVKKFEVAATCAEFKMIIELFLYLNADKILYVSQCPNEDCG